MVRVLLRVLGSSDWGDNGQGCWALLAGETTVRILGSLAFGAGWRTLKTLKVTRTTKKKKKKMLSLPACSVPATEEPIAGIHISSGPYFPNNRHVKVKKEKKTAWLT